MSGEIDPVLRFLRAHVGGRRLQGVWLFGSRARGEAKPGSDFDLAVLCEPPLGLDRLVVAERIARDAGVEVDLIDLRTSSATLAWEVLTTGTLVDESDEEAVQQFLRRARFEAEDELRRNRIIVEAQRRAP
jgi:predicted nucleotidyltransferase